MFDYSLWATECPINFSRHGTTGAPTDVPEYIMLSAAGDDNGFLDKFSNGTTGLLK